MASWSVLLALAGYEYHGPQGYLAFSPKITPENFRAAFTAAQGWGSFAQQRDGSTQRERIEMAWGTLRLQKLAFDVAEGVSTDHIEVSVNGKTCKVGHTREADRVVIVLAKPALLDEGATLEVAIA